MIVRIFPNLGMPNHFFTKNHLAVPDGRHLSVAAAGVKTDTTPVQFLAHWFRFFIFFRHSVRFRKLHCKFFFVYPAHKTGVEFPDSPGSISLFEPLPYILRAAGDNLPTALNPQKTFDQPLNIPETLFFLPAALGKHLGPVYGNLTFLPLNTDCHRGSLPGSFDRLQKSSVLQRNWTKIRIQNRNFF